MANERKLRLGVELTGEETFKAGMQKIETGLKNVKAAQTNLNSEYDKGDKSLAKYTQQQALLQNKLQLQRQRLDQIRKEYERVAAAQGENSDAAQKLARDYEYAEAACNGTERELKELGNEMKTATSRIEAFKAELKKGDSQLQKIGESIDKFGKKLTMSLTVPLTAAAGVCVKSFMDFEDEMASVSTIADTTAISLSDLSDQALEASNATGIAATEIAKGAYQAISAGVETAEAMEYMEAAAKAAKAGQTDISTVVNGSTSIMNAWKISTENATGVFEKMIIAQNMGKTTLGEIASQIGQLTGLAPGLNVSLEETLAATAALTKNGVQTSSAINGLKAVFSGILKPTAEARAEAEKLGIEFSAAGLKAKGLTGFLADIQAKTGGSEESLARLFGSVEGLSQVMLLGGAAAEDYAATLDAMADSAGALEDAFGKRTSSRAEQLKAALNSLNNEAIKLGQSLAPMVDVAAGAIGRLAELMNSMTPAQQQTLLTIAGVLAAVGPIVSGVGKITSAVGGVKKAFTALSALAGGSGPLGLILIAISAIVAGVILLKKHLDGLSKGNQVKAAFSNVTIDTTKVDEAIAAAEAMEYEMKLEAEAIINLKQDGEDIHQQVLGLLSGEIDQAVIQEKVNGWLDPIYDTITTSYETKKAALDKALAAGLITQAEYDAQLEALTEQTNELRETLNAEQQAYLDYINAIIESGEEPTAEQLAKLEEMRQGIADIANEINMMELNAEGHSLNDYVTNWLTDGATETREQKEAIRKLIDDWLNPVFDEIQAGYDEKKAALDEMLAAGLIDQTTYDQSLAELNETTEQTKKALEAEKQAYVDYVMKLAAANREPTEEEIARLGELRDNIITVAEEINAINFNQIGEDIGAGIAAALTQKSAAEAVAELYDDVVLAIANGKEAVEAAFVEYGIDEGTAKTAAESITAAAGVINGALEGLSLSPEAIQAISTMAASGGDLATLIESFGIEDGAATAAAETITGAIKTISDAIEALDISQAAKDAITNAALYGENVASAIAAFGIDGETATAAAETINGIMANINAAIEGLGLSDEANAAITDVIANGGNVENALLAYGVDEETAKNVAASITSGMAAIDETISGLKLSEAATNAVINTAAQGGDVLALIKSFGVEDGEATAAAATITSAFAALNGALEGLGLSEEAQSAIKTVTESGGDVKKALEAYGVDAETAESVAQTITDATNTINETLSALELTPPALGAGVSETDLAAWRTAVDAWLEPVFGAVEDSYNEKKAKLDAALAAGIIDRETYEQSLEDLTTQTNETKDALTEEKQAYIDYVDEIAKQSGGATEEQIAKLEEMRDTIIGIGESILEAQNVATQAAKASYTLVSSGSKAATTEDVAVAVKYLQVDRAQQKAAAKDFYDLQMALLQEQFDGAEGDIEAQAAVTVKMEEARALNEKQLADIETDYTAQLSAMFEGLAAKYPEEVEKLKEVARKQNLYEEYIAAALDFETANTPDVLADARARIREIYQQVFGEELSSDAIATASIAIGDELTKQLKESVDGIDKNAIFEDLSTAIGTGALEGLDVSQAGEVLRSLLTSLDLSDDGKTAGEKLIAGAAEGVTLSEQKWNDAVIAACEAANNALREKQGIHSPSSVWREFGSNMAQGAAQGIESGKSLILAAINQIITAINNTRKQFVAAGRNSIQGLIEGANSKRSALIQTYTSIAGAAIAAARNRLKEASPSRVFYEIGANTGEGMIRGVVSKAAQVKRAMIAMVNPEGVANAQSDDAQGGQNGAQTRPQTTGAPIINVYYTGAVTGRESRKLAQQLGGYLNGQLKAKGV